MDRVLFRLVFSCSLLVVFFFLLPGVPEVSLAATSPARERGATAFQNSGCPRCHSITGVGGTRGPDLGAVSRRRTPAQIRRQILHGGHGMPPFGRVLSLRDVDDLVEFLSGCRSEKAPGCRTWSTPPAKPAAPTGGDGSGSQ